MTVTELVDRYPVIGDVRELFIDYLGRRQATLVYISLLTLSRTLVGTFWTAITQINPDQSDLRISDETYQQWRAGLRTKPDGSERLDIDSHLVAARALYYDIQAWAAEQPEHWARWVAPCPVPPSEMRGRMKRGRRATERIAERTRRRQPLLADLVEHVEARLHRVTAMLVAATALGPDELVVFDANTYRRRHTEHDALNRRLGQRESVRVRCDETGEELNLTRDENSAFWEWAFVEVLRHTGVRVEELVELSQLSIRRYERPNGEVVALLVVAPSKTDRERVIPMSAELFHVILTMSTRHIWRWSTSASTSRSGIRQVRLDARHRDHGVGHCRRHRQVLHESIDEFVEAVDEYGPYLAPCPTHGGPPARGVGRSQASAELGQLIAEQRSQVVGAG